MIVYDLVHGYQPFNPPNFIPDWVTSNLQSVFLPTSQAMAKGVVRRGVQLQGWTIDAWLQSPTTIKTLAEQTLANLRAAKQAGFIEIGISGYSHPILPLLTEDLIYAQIKIDLDTVTKYIGEPTWFWFPEGAVNGKSLEALFKWFPKLIAVIPDTAVARQNFSGFIKIKHTNGGEQKAIVCNSLLKDIMMNSAYLEAKPSYVPENVNWKKAQSMVHNGERFGQVLHELGSGTHVLARDWENKGSKDGLFPIDGGGADVRGLVELEAEFKLPSEVEWEVVKTVGIDGIMPGCWEVTAAKDDPFPYWWPNENSSYWQSLDEEGKTWVLKWKQSVTEYNERFTKIIATSGGIEAALNDKELYQKIKESLPALMSCIPWHFLGRSEWGTDRNFAKEAWEKIVIEANQKLSK